MLQTLPNPTAWKPIYQQWKRPYVPNQPKRPFFLTDANFTEYLLQPVIGTEQSSGKPEIPQTVTQHTKQSNPQSLGVRSLPGGPITPQLRERLLGKAPLRLVVKREPQYPAQNEQLEWNQSADQPTHWLETLECGHTQETLFDLQVYGGETICVIPCAKRRRCQPCKQIQLGAKKDSQSAKFSQDSQVPVVGKKESK